MTYGHVTSFLPFSSILQPLQHQHAPLHFTLTALTHVAKFIYDLFNDALNNLHYMTFNDRMAIYNEMERLWKNVGVVRFAVPFQNLPGATELNHENPQSG
jgi:hypothetical protein